MKASVEEINKVQRRIKVELATTIVNDEFAKVYRKVQQQARIKGFRPGKAPLNIIRKFYAQAVAADVADQLVRNHLFIAIQNNELRPISAPVLETASLPQENQDYNFTALVDILPEIKIEGYKGLKLSFKPMKVDESAMTRELELLRRRQAKTKELPEDTAAAVGHLLYITHHAKDEKGLDVPGAHAHQVPVVIGQQDVLPDIEAALTGMKAGETKTVEVVIPKDYNDLDLAGKKLQMSLHVEKVVELILPALDDELAKDLGEENLAKLKERVQRSLDKAADQQKRNQLEYAILKQLSEKNPIEVPPSMVDQVIDAMIDEMQWHNDKERQSAKHDKEFRTRFLDNAKEKTRNTLILHEIIQSEKIAVNDEEVDAHICDMLPGLANGQKPDEKIMKNLRKSFGNQAKENLLITKAIDTILSSATVTEQTA